MQPGQLLNHRYRIERELSAGGFGQTFIATIVDLPSQPQVVVKLFKPQSNDPATWQIAKRLFQQEAEILENLGKDNDRIPSLYAYFEFDNDFYLVQEFIVRNVLTTELQGNKLSPTATLNVVKEILTGLKTVHFKNVIHRDLKPDNIIRRRSDGKLVLIDFGAVKQVRAASASAAAIPTTAISQTIGIGTAGYMPTEQSLGYPRPASDVYAVGAIAVQCLTGLQPHLLFDRDSLRLEWQHLCRVDRQTANVLERMVEPDYRHRYNNASEALAAIEALISPPPQPKVQPPPSPPTPRNPLPRQGNTLQPIVPYPRRNFLKWAGYGGGGLLGAWILAQLLPKSDNPPPSPSELGLQVIQFASVKLDSSGKEVGKPQGKAEVFDESLGNGLSMRMVKIPAGKFLMGSPASERDLENDESPQHEVSLSEFYMAQTLVTQAQWQAIMGNNPSYFKGDGRLPVDRVSWLDAMDFCKKLSQKSGRRYILPSEAQWEYACRAGTTTPFAYGETITTAVVNYNGSFPYGNAPKGENRQKTTPVGSFPPNAFGLYDMHGNLWEWCLQEWVNNYNGAPTDGSARGDINSLAENQQRLLRGGSWYDLARNCRSAFRSRNGASIRNNNVGFR
jgi:formylglycine-generating enzyme required for sulfatase activity/tRNA A-37 threonylcarbamoyl transferase component Bud32